MREKEAFEFDEAYRLERDFAANEDYLSAFVMQQFGDMDYNPDRPVRISFDFILSERGVEIDNYDVQLAIYEGEEMSTPATVADLIEVAKTLPGAEVINRFGVHPDGTEFLRGQSLVIPLTEGVA